MLFTIKQYVVALYESLKDEKEIDQINQKIFNFAKLLKKNNDLKLKNKILLEFEKYWKEKQGIINILIKNTNPLEEEQKKEIINWFLVHGEKLLNKKIKSIEIKEEIDKNLIGGMILKIEDLIFDNCIKKQLKKAREKLI
ncbi:MAG: F0F1 ATP synthase subunit delta [Patescibacteria group bacterium]